MGDVTRAHLFNVVTPVSLTQAAAVVALRTPDDDAAAPVAECSAAATWWWPSWPATLVSAAGGWSLLVDLTLLRAQRPEAAQRLLELGARGRHRDGRLGAGQRPAARPHRLRQRPVGRLAGLGERFAGRAGAR